MDTTRLFDVSDKVVLVTGGAKGIGYMISAGFVAAGATVYISSRKGNDCERVAKELTERGPGKAIALPADLMKLEDCHHLFKQLSERESKLHVLVNNAGNNWGAPFDKYPDQAWGRVLGLNLHRVFTITQLCTPLLASTACKDDPGRIINIGSVNGERVSSLETYAYGASKAGLHHLSRALAQRLGSKHITSNTLACGPFPSNMMKATLERSGDAIVAQLPLARLGGMEDVAGACIFLSSRAGSYVSGATIALDGGGMTSPML